MTQHSNLVTGGFIRELIEEIITRLRQEAEQPTPIEFQPECIAIVPLWAREHLAAIALEMWRSSLPERPSGE